MIKTIEITEIQKQKILSLNENHFNDLKSKRIKPAKLTNTISAFANSVGGDIYVGIEENDTSSSQYREWIGFTDEEEANAHIQVFEKLFPLGDYFTYNFYENSSENGVILHLSIKKNPKVITASNGKIYKRRSAQNLPIESEEEKRRLELDKGIQSYEDHTLNLPIDFVSDSLSICFFTF